MEFEKSNALETLLPFENSFSSKPHLNSQSAPGLEQSLHGSVGKWQSLSSSDGYLNQYSTVTPGEVLMLPSSKDSSIAAGDPLTGVGGINSFVGQGDKLLRSGTNNANGEIVFIDSSVQDYQSLIATIKPGTEVAVLDPVRNEVEQIGQYLAGRSGISSVSIVSHGNSGSLQLGGTKLGLDTLNNYSSALQSWSKSLTADADILLYGCDVANGDSGTAFVKQLSQLTGADVAASSDLTGSAALGGDWTLEFSTGSIELSQAFQVGSLAAYQSILAIGPDNSGYVAVSTSFQSNVDLVPGAAGVVTLSTLNSVDDSPTEAINLGTNTFTFYGQTYTDNSQLFISVNGLITFGTGNGTYTNDDLTSGIPQAAIAPVWDDWVTYVNETPDDLVLYQFQDLNNDSTSDQLVIEWNNVHNISNTSAGDATYQTILNLNTGSTNGNIIFNYSDLGIPNTNLDEAGSATVGIKATGTQGSNRLLISQNTTESPYVGTGRAILVTNNTPSLDLNGDQTKDAIGINFTNSFAEGEGAVSIIDSTNLSLVTPGSSTLTSATITLTNPLDGVAEVLAADIVGTNIAAAYDSTTGTLALTGADTVTNYQQVLRSITYNNAAANPNSTNRTITFVTSDGTNTSPLATSTIVPNAPLLDLNGTAPGINYIGSFPGGAAVTAVDSANLTLSVPESPNLSSATVRISNLRNGASEILAADTTSTNITANYSLGVLDLTGADTVANYQQVLRSITYNNTAASPDTRARLINFTVNDGTKTSPVATTTLRFGNPPTISTVANQTIKEDDSTEAISFTIGDVETAADALTVTALSSNQILIPNNNIVLGGSDANRTVTITPAANLNGTTVLTLRVRDGSDITTDRTFSLTVNPVNDVPTVAIPSADQTASENSLYSFQVDANSFNDVDAADTLTYTATLADGNTLPTWLTFDPNTRTFSGTPLNNDVATLDITVTATDGDGISASDNFTLSTSNTNDDPVARGDVLSTLRVEPITISRTDLLVNDTDIDGDTLSIVGFTQPSNGTMVDNGNDTFTYTPNTHFGGTDSFTYTISDGQGGTANSSVNLTVNTEDGIFNLVQLNQFFNTLNLTASSVFDESFYLAQNPDAAQAVAGGTFSSGFEHFQLFGQAEDRDPSLLFNNQLYLAQNPDIERAVSAGDFQSGFEHFLRFGQFERRNYRSLNFDESFYLEHNPDVAQAVTDGASQSGFEHFLSSGQTEGRDPSVVFDEDFYLANNTDVAQAVAAGAFRSGFDHFMRSGIFENRNPSRLFDNNLYLAENQDVAQAVAAGALRSGFDHFIRFGQFEGRQPNLELFNEDFYLANNTDVAQAVVAGAFRSGFDHFIQSGQVEGRNPSDLFDEDFYLASNQDVAQAVADGAFRSGFEHFIRFGRAEGRSTVG